MDMLGLIAAVAAIIVAWKLKGRVAALEQRTQALEASLRSALDPTALGRATPAPEAPEPAAPAAEPAIAKAVTPAGDDPAASGAPPPTNSPPAAALPAPASARVPSLEERLGTRWAVWIGGLALAAGALALVRYSIEQGLFGPGMRIALGALFSAGLVAAGEWLRRGTLRIDFAAVPTAHIPGVLTAAGTMGAFATIYAAHALYGFIGPAAAFVLLGATGIATMLAAAVHGPALAGLGLAGALVTPLLVAQVENPSPWPVVLYLAVVAAATYALARARRWLWLAGSVVAGAVIWGLALGLDAPTAGTWDLARQTHLLVQLALAAAFLAYEPHAGTPDDTAEIDWIAAAALGALAALAAITLATTSFEEAGWLLMAVLAMGLLAGTAYLVPAAATALALAGLVAIAAALSWPGLKAPPDTRFLWPAVADLVRLPDSARGNLTFAAFASLGVMGVGTWRLWIGRTLPRPISGTYALGAILTPILILIVVYLRMTQFDRSIPFALVAVLLAGLLYLVADRFDNVPANEKSDHTRLMISLYAAGCTAAMAIAFTMALERGYLTVAFAVTAATTALFAVIDKIPSLRWMVGAIGFLVLARLGWDPRIAGDSVGTIAIFNWLLLGYGAPALAFLFAGYVLKRERDDIPARLSDALGLVFAALLVVFQIRHALHGGDIRAATSGHVEQGLFALTAFSFAAILNRLDLARGNVVFRTAMIVAGVIGAIIAVGGLLGAENPYLTNERIAGPPVFSSLLLAYLLPGIAAAVLARTSRGSRPDWYVMGAAAMALLLVFTWATLETRHLFQGEQIGFLRGTSSAEQWAYSAVWLLLGIAFLAYGLARSSVEARIASAGLVVLSAVKVFVFDTAGVTGIWRPLSFICLGAVLIGIGLVYQRLIFARPAGAAPTPASPSVTPP